MAVTIGTDTFALIMGAANTLGLVYTFGVRMARLELKTDTMWDVIVKSALTDARHGGLLQQNSPLALNRDVSSHFQLLGPKMQEIYTAAKEKRMKDSEVILIFARKFGDELIEQVCLPLGINLGSALVAAIQYCKEGTSRAGY